MDTLFLNSNPLILLLVFNLFSSSLLFCLPNTYPYLREVSLISSFFQLYIGTYVWFLFDNLSLDLNFSFIAEFTSFSAFLPSFRFGVDGLGVNFLLLTLLLLPVCIIVSWHSINDRPGWFNGFLHLVTLLLIFVFISQDFLCFYIFFEAVLIPVFILILRWGSRDRKVHAAYQFFLYTFVGSLAMLVSIYYLYTTVGSTDVGLLKTYGSFGAAGYWIWLATFFAFAVKLPVVPFHIWLPEAHVEAPTAGSVLLAGILLKMGGYGIIKFLLPIFPLESLYFQSFAAVFGIFSIVYAAFATLRQTDLKKIVAYSSVCHMNYVTIALLSFTYSSLQGAVYLMIAHAFVSSALFICVGSLYDRYKTRVLFYYGGIAFGMPIYSLFFLLFTLASVSFPGTSNFVGEFYSLLGLSKTSMLACLIATLTLIVNGAYSFWFYNRVVYGVPKVSKFNDLNLEEFVVLFVLLLLTLLTGFFPFVVMDSCALSMFSVLNSVWTI